MSAHGRGSAAADENSKEPKAALGLSATAVVALVLGLAGAVLLALTEVSTVIEIRARDAVLETQTGGDRHSWALLVIAVAAIPLSWLAAVLRSRPAALGLAALGAVALLFWGVGDLPDAGSAGSYGITYEEAEAVSGPGLTLEALGGFALLASAGISLFFVSAPATTRARRRARPARPRTDQS